MSVVGTIQVEPLDATFEALVRDVSLAGASDTAIAELTELWLEYALLVFPGQQMTQHDQDEFARRFGDLKFTASPLTNIQRDGTLVASFLANDRRSNRRGRTERSRGTRCARSNVEREELGSRGTAAIDDGEVRLTAPRCPNLASSQQGRRGGRDISEVTFLPPPGIFRDK